MNATDPNRPRKYSPIGPVGFLLTFSTYGTWLHGDDRGSVDRKGNNLPGTSVIAPDPQRMVNETRRLTHPPVTFSVAQRKCVDRTIRDVSEHRKWVLHAVNARTKHVHVVVTALKPPEPVMNSLKSWCTRRMRENGLWLSEHSPWSRHGSTRYLWDEGDLRRACEYVLYRQGSNLLGDD